MPHYLKFYVLATLLALFTASTVQAAAFRKLEPVAPPPLVLTDINGIKQDLSAYRGKVVLVNFWASWCPPCREEMPSMQRLSQKMANKPFVVLGVASGEEQADFTAFLGIVKVTFPILPDPSAATTKRWKVYGLPTSFLVDTEGRLRYVLTGPTEWDTPETIQLIDTLFKH